MTTLSRSPARPQRSEKTRPVPNDLAAAAVAILLVIGAMGAAATFVVWMGSILISSMFQ